MSKPSTRSPFPSISTSNWGGRSQPLDELGSERLGMEAVAQRSTHLAQLWIGLGESARGLALMVLDQGGEDVGHGLVERAGLAVVDEASERSKEGSEARIQAPQSLFVGKEGHIPFGRWQDGRENVSPCGRAPVGPAAPPG